MTFALVRKTSLKLVFIAVSISSYAQKPDLQQQYIIDIHGERHDLFEFIEHVEIIRLEETENSLLPRIEFYYELSNGFAIRNHNSKSLALFDTKGNFKTAINRFGQGPEEYRNLGTVWEKNDQINLFSSQSRSVLTFDLQGNYLKTTPINYPEEIRGGAIAPYKDGYVVQVLDKPKIKRSSHELMFLDKKFENVSFAVPRPTPHPFPVNHGNRFSYLNDQLIWKKRLSDSIYIIKENQPDFFMRFDFGEDWVWNDPKTISNQKAAFNAIWKDDTKVWEVISKTGEKYILLAYYFKIIDNEKGLIDRETGEFYRLDLRKKNREDFDLFLLQWQGDRLICSLQAFDVEEFLENLDDDQYSIAGGLKYEDFAFSENPVLLKIKFKVPK